MCLLIANPLIDASKKGKRICKKKKKLAGCQTSEFGCCFDDKTPAKGPFSAGTTKKEDMFYLNIYFFNKSNLKFQ